MVEPRTNVVPLHTCKQDDCVLRSVYPVVRKRRELLEDRCDALSEQNLLLKVAIAILLLVALGAVLFAAGVWRPNQIV